MQNAGDPVSYLCAWLALVPQALCVIYVTLIWSTREVEILLMFVGQMGCEALNFLLKRLIKEERPKRNAFPLRLKIELAGVNKLFVIEMYGKGYGMPSSHAQFVTFFSLTLALFLLYRHNPKLSRAQTSTSLPQRALLSFAALLCAAAVAVSRIYLNYHTGKQVLVGCAAGMFSAAAWFASTMWLRRSGLLGWGLDTKLAKALRMRDLVVEEDLAEAGWQRWEKRRRPRTGETDHEMINKKNG